MERTTYMQKKRKGGFTLAEFLVVIAITTILAGVSFCLLYTSPSPRD